MLDATLFNKFLVSEGKESLSYKDFMVKIKGLEPSLNLDPAWLFVAACFSVIALLFIVRKINTTKAASGVNTS